VSAFLILVDYFPIQEVFEQPLNNGFPICLGGWKMEVPNLGWGMLSEPGSEILIT